jgi:hypothetical protein
MNTMNKLKYLFLFSLLFVFNGCYNEPQDHSDDEGKVVILLQFLNKVNGETLQLGSSKKYTDASGEEFYIEKLKYYISNIKLRNAKNGTYFIEPMSYHLISSEQTSGPSIELEIPTGEYDQLQFGIGVDAEKNTSMSYDGDLDPNNSMAWDWASGYKFLVLEGKYFTPTTGVDGGGLVFHIGENKNYKTVTIPMQSTPITMNDHHKTITVNVAVEEMWKAPNPVKFDDIHEAMSGDNASKIADNYAEGMFSIQ